METKSTEFTTSAEMSGKFKVTNSMVVIDEVIEKAVMAAEKIGEEVAETLRERGAGDILKQAREQIAVAQNDLRIPKSK